MSTRHNIPWSPGGVPASVPEQFLTYSIWQLRENHFPRLREAVELLSDEEVWMRDGKSSNSIGNLLQHLAGNIRQHIVGGVGGGSQMRDRDGEFNARVGVSGNELLKKLEETILEACAVLEKFDSAKLLERRTIQNKEVLVMDDIYHVVEHFSYHTGQIVYVVKARKEHRFPWYANLDTNIK